MRGTSLDLIECENLIAVHWNTHDKATLNRQAPDAGHIILPR